VEMLSQPFSPRRTVYGFVDRQNLPGLFRVFDFANPDRHSPQRYVTTSPQQALFMLNSPFVAEQAARLNTRPELNGTPVGERIQRLYRMVYGRAARPTEVALGLRFLTATEPAAPLADPAWQYGWGEVDEAAKRVKSFQPLAHFTGTAWQGGPAWPDPTAGWVQFTATGGHVGDDLRRAAIRRWTAPRDGTFTVSGTIRHAFPAGDGIRARVVSSRSGPLGEWTLHNTTAEAALPAVELKRGDTLDFVADCRAEVNSDQFEWAPVISTAPAAGGAGGSWSAQLGFGAPGIPAWEQYVQALLLANEFVFVD